MSLIESIDQGIGSILLTLLVAIAATACLLCTPAALLLFAIDQALTLELDAGQLWVFAATLSFLLFVGSVIVGERAVMLYIWAGILMPVTLGVAYFGFDLEWVKTFCLAFMGQR